MIDFAISADCNGKNLLEGFSVQQNHKLLTTLQFMCHCFLVAMHEKKDCIYKHLLVDLTSLPDHFLLSFLFEQIAVVFH